jgi:phosphate acetyltransferase
MNIFDKIYGQARSNPKKIVLPEGSEPRIIEAASYINKQNIAQIVLLGEKEKIIAKAAENNLTIEGIEIIDPREDDCLEEYAQAYWRLRKHKGVTIQDARDLLKHDFVYFATMMLHQKRVEGFVAGACHTTSNVARAIFRCIKINPCFNTASGAFLVEVQDKQYGEEGLFLFADCAIVPEPSARQLADIAVASAELWLRVTQYKPRIAMLSFSTKGSSSATTVDKVRMACEIVKKERPNLIIDGELQVDSAVVPAIAKIKVPQSPLAGKANVLIFPDLNSGNIAYKLMQRLAQSRVAGPFIQGMSCPCSDLSRGASSQEIVDTIAVTAVMAQ